MSAALSSPTDVAVDAAGDIHLSTRPAHWDYQFHGHVRRVDSGDGLIETLGSTPGVIGGLELDRRGNLFFADTENFRIRRLSLVSQPPVAVAGADITVECASQAGAAVTLDGSASSDPDSTPGTRDDIVAYEWVTDLGGPSEAPLGSGETLETTLPPGRHEISLVVTDSFGERRADQMIVEVGDTTPPALGIAAGRALLWPPNHRMVPINPVVTAADRCGGSTISLVSVTSNEPDDAPGQADGSTVNDIQGVEPGAADFQFALRAERSTAGSGRVYTITYSAVDEAGNISFETAVVTVPVSNPASKGRPHGRNNPPRRSTPRRGSGHR